MRYPFAAVETGEVFEQPAATTYQPAQDELPPRAQDLEHERDVA
jgi:hypothetical protein